MANNNVLICFHYNSIKRQIKKKKKKNIDGNRSDKTFTEFTTLNGCYSQGRYGKTILFYFFYL